MSSLVLALALMHSFSAAAQDPLDSISKHDKRTARALVKSGDAKFKAGDFAGALKDYRGAQTLVRVPTTIIEVAKTLDAMGRLLEARRRYRQVLDFPHHTDEPKAFEQSRARATLLVKELDERIPKLIVNVHGAEPSAALTVLVDGNPIAPAQPIEIDPGKHLAEVSASGYEPASRNVSVKEGSTSTVVLSLKVDSLGFGQEPVPVAPPAPAPPPAANGSELSWLPYALFASSGVGLALGTVTGVVSLTKASSFEEQRLPDGHFPESARALQDDSLALAHVSTVGFVFAGVTATVGAVLLIVDIDDSDAEVGLTIAPTSAYLRGTF